MKQAQKPGTEIETWEDTIAMLRAGAPPSHVLPNIRALLRELPSSPSPGPPPEPRTPTSRLYHEINGNVFQVPYLRAPPHLWRLLAEPGSEAPTRLFDGELHVDVLELFQPRFVQPPPDSVREELQKSECETETFTIDVGDRFEKALWTNADFRMFAEKLSSLKAGVAPGLPRLTEEDWAFVISIADFPIDLTFISNAIRTISQPEFCRIVLASVLPLLVQQAETGTFLEVVSTAVALGKLDQVPAKKLTDLLARYENLGALGALTQVHIVCRR